MRITILTYAQPSMIISIIVFGLIDIFTERPAHDFGGAFAGSIVSMFSLSSVFAIQNEIMNSPDPGFYAGVFFGSFLGWFIGVMIRGMVSSAIIGGIIGLMGGLAIIWETNTAIFERNWLDEYFNHSVIALSASSPLIFIPIFSIIGYVVGKPIGTWAENKVRQHRLERQRLAEEQRRKKEARLEAERREQERREMERRRVEEERRRREEEEKRRLEGMKQEIIEKIEEVTKNE